MNPILTMLRCAALASTAAFAACAIAQAPPPGYDGPFPSAASTAALRSLFQAPWVDKERRIDGGSFQLQDGKVTPFTLGPCSATTIELRTATVKGPHVRLTKGVTGVSLPAATDGDVAATLRWLGQPLPPGVAGEPTDAWRVAAGRVEALGEVSNGLRAGLRLEKPGHVELLLWNVGDAKSNVNGVATLLVDGVALPLHMQWPPKAKPDAGNCALQLQPGSTFTISVDIGAAWQAVGKPALANGKHALEFTLAFANAANAGKDAEPPQVLRSKKLDIVLGESRATDAGAPRKADK